MLMPRSLLIAERFSMRGSGGAAGRRPSVGPKQSGAAAVVGGLPLVVDTGAVARALQRVSTGCGS
jgi:hypothetical protein